MEDPIITTREAAKLLGVSIRTAQTWIEEHGVDSWKTPGGHRRVRQSAVMDLKARLAAKEMPRSMLVLVHAPSHKLHTYTEPLSLLPGCTEHASSDPVATLLTAGHLLPALMIIEAEPGNADWLRLVQGVLQHPALGHTQVIITGGATASDFANLGGLARRLQLLAAGASSATLQATVSQCLADRQAPAPRPAEQGLAHVSSNESQRLMAVAASGVVDTPEEEAFNEITRLAAAVIEVPIALLTLLTPDRQWFKSHWGLDQSETPRSWAFCNFTIQQDDVFVVEDACLDLRFASNPLVTGEPGIRFYAGANIRDSQGYALGSLCVIDRVPRRLLPSQRDALTTLAGLASDRISLRVTERQLRWATAGTADRAAGSDR